MTSITVSPSESQEEIVQKSTPSNDVLIAEGNSATGQGHDQAQQQDHESEEETRRRLEEWRYMAANLQGGFTQMPDQVRKDPTLSTSAKIVYEHLLGYMWQQEWCWPSQQRIADELGISRRTVIRACKELYNRCYIEKWRRGLNRTNVYFINPLAFVVSFKKSGRGTGVLLQANGPEHRAHPSTTPAPALITALCQNVTSRSATMSHPEVPESHIKQYEEKRDSKEKDRFSNNSVSTEKGMGAWTIGSSEQSTKPKEKGTNKNQTPNILTSSKTNSSTNTLEPAAADHAKGVKGAKKEPPPSAQAQAIAEQTGIPANHLTELNIAQEPRRRSIPDFIVHMMTTFTYDLGDSSRNIKSNITRASKLYYFGVDFIEQAQEDPEGWFVNLLFAIKEDALRVRGIRRRTGSRINRLPVFFTLLEKVFAFSPDELAFVRSNEPFYEPEDRQ